MRLKHLLSRSFLLAAGLLAGTSAWAGDKTVTKYTFDSATEPSLTVGSKATLDYSYTSVISKTKFLNIWGANDKNGATSISLGSTDLSKETWTLEFDWAGYSGANKKAGATILKAGETNLFTIADAADWGKTFTLTYGESGSATLACAACNKSSRISAKTGEALNTTDYWHHFKIVGSSDGITLTVTKASDGTKEIDGVTLSSTNVNPTAISMQPGSCGSVAIDELSLSYYVEGEVIQTPTASYTNVNGIYRTITATCDTEGATLYYSTDGTTYTEGASYTASESGTVYFKAVKGTSESDVLEFAVTAGEAITLITPTISRSNNTTVTITADQSSLLLTPTATIYYSYNGSNYAVYENAITVSADATISAYAVAEGYTNSATATRAVALFPTNLAQVENAKYSNGYTNGAYSETTTTTEKATYAAYLLDDVQWGKNVYLQTTGWGIRTKGGWYIDGNSSWLLMKSMKKGDIIVATLTQGATSTVNATYAEKYTYGTNYAYTVDEDGDVELCFARVSSSVNNYFTSISAYSSYVPVTISDAKYATFVTPAALDFSSTGVKAFAVKYDNGTISYSEVTAVPANTAVLVYAEAGTYSIPVAASADALTDNNLMAATAAVTCDGTQYVLANGDSGLGWYKAESGTIAAGKGYLKVDAATAKNFYPVVDNTVTAIEAVNGEEEAVKNQNIYNLAGQRVSGAYKGVVIKGGKKYIVK